jgi:NAD(P)-dependent dehydrogenase (short-subunit alcohol dehydrogenase family)
VTAEIIDGKSFAEGLRARIAAAVSAFVSAAGRKPGLAVVLVGEDAASQVYVRSKARATVAAGMESFEHRLPASASQAELMALVEQLNWDDAVDGILVQLPLPGQMDEKAVIAAAPTSSESRWCSFFSAKIAPSRLRTAGPETCPKWSAAGTSSSPPWVSRRWSAAIG